MGKKREEERAKKKIWKTEEENDGRKKNLHLNGL
jgi:hypothetical protein